MPSNHLQKKRLKPCTAVAIQRDKGVGRERRSGVGIDVTNYWHLLVERVCTHYNATTQAFFLQFSALYGPAMDTTTLESNPVE